MRLLVSSVLLAALIPAAAPAAEPCRQIHGRALLYRGDGFYAIWHIGTHHVFMPADDPSYKLLCRYLDCERPDRMPALFADFTLCPTEPFQPGAAQHAIVRKIEHPVVVPEWSPGKPTHPPN